MAFSITRSFYFEQSESALPPQAQAATYAYGHCGLLLSTTVLFNVENIRVTGASNYTPQEIIDASGVEAGDNLVRLSTDKVSSQITSRLVYIEKAHLSRSFPSTLIINVEASEPEANFITDHGIYLISKGGKILEKIDEPKANLFNFTGTDPKLELLPGDKYASNDEHKDTVVYQMMTLLDTGNYSTVTSVDVTDRADIKCVFDNRITVSLGSVNDLEYKMNFAKEIIETKATRPRALLPFFPTQTAHHSLTRKAWKTTPRSITTTLLP